MADNNWLKHKLAWLDALAQDQPTRGVAHDIGILLVRRYLHSKKRYAWISISRLASELGVSSSSVLRAFDKLISAGWLVRWKQGGHGPGDSNHYYLPDCIPKPKRSVKKGSVHATKDATTRVAPTQNKGSVHATTRVAPTQNKGSVHATQVFNDEYEGSQRESQAASAAALSN